MRCVITYRDERVECAVEPLQAGADSPRPRYCVHVWPRDEARHASARLLPPKCFADFAALRASLRSDHKAAWSSDLGAVEVSSSFRFLFVWLCRQLLEARGVNVRLSECNRQP